MAWKLGVPTGFALLAFGFMQHALAAQVERIPQAATQRSITIAAFLMDDDVLSQVSAANASSVPSILADAYRVGRVRLHYTKSSDQEAGSAGKDGDFEQRLATTWDRAGREVGHDSQSRPLGLVATWKREGSTIKVDVLYAEKGSLVKVGRTRLPTYVHSEMQGQTIPLFNRSEGFVLSLPRNSARKGTGAALVIVSPSAISPATAISSFELAGRYINLIN